MDTAHWILLIWLGTVVVSTAVTGWIVLWHRLNLRQSALRLQAAFDALPFDTPLGRVNGDSLTVVKIAYRLDQDDHSLHARNGPDRWDSLWYAAGPGPSYFLAVCMPEGCVAPRWRVRRLDETRMRAALSGDHRAEMLAFGEAIEA